MLYFTVYKFKPLLYKIAFNQNNTKVHLVVRHATYILCFLSVGGLELVMDCAVLSGSFKLFDIVSTEQYFKAYPAFKWSFLRVSTTKTKGLFYS